MKNRRKTRKNIKIRAGGNCVSGSTNPECDSRSSSRDPNRKIPTFYSANPEPKSQIKNTEIIFGDKSNPVWSPNSISRKSKPFNNNRKIPKGR
jgi:hypothetical protein